MTLSLRSLRCGAGALALAALVAFPLAAGTPPANDVCSGAVVIPGTGPFPYAAAPVDTTGATNDSGDPAFPCNGKFASPVPAGAVSKSVWYTFTPATTDNYQIDTLGSTPTGSYDTILAVFTGSCGSLTPVTNACNDDTAGSLLSAVQTRLTAGTTYYILVAGLGSLDFLTHNIVPSPGGTLHLNVSHVQVSYPYSYVVPSVAHAQGVTLYVSDLVVTNSDTSDGSFTIQFLGHGNFGDTTMPSSQPTSAPNTIAAGGTALFQDVLSSIGVNPSTNPYGALLIRSTVKLMTGARTYTTAAAGGTFGQFALGVDTAGTILGGNQSGRFVGIREDANSRTNLAIFNLANTPCNVQFQLVNPNGALYTGGSTQIRVVPPNTMVQASGLRNLFTVSDDIVSSSVVLTDMTGGCQVGGVAYVIDGNTTAGTNDPYAVPLQK